MNGQMVMASPVVELQQLKPMWRVYADMLVQQDARLHASEPLQRIVYRQRNVSARPADVVAYRDVCGESPPGLMPPVYPHVMATPLQLNLLGSDDFPLRLAGLVHLGQAIEWRKPFHVDDVVDIECSVSGPQDAEAGWVFSLETNILRKGDCIWREEISFLKPERRARPKRRGREGDGSRFVPLLHLQFMEDTGRRYARVSGDWNPIHLWPFTAKLFGFRRPIAHGMYSLARCLSILQARGVELAGHRLEAQFRAPVVLPAFANFCLSERDPEGKFALTDARKGRILLEGELHRL